jgi:hypothetical protein
MNIEHFIENINMIKAGKGTCQSYRIILERYDAKGLHKILEYLSYETPPVEELYDLLETNFKLEKRCSGDCGCQK